MEQEKKGLEKFLGWVAEQPASPQEEKARAIAERKAMEGTWLEAITMNEDGSLMIVSTQYLIGGGIADGCTESAPGDSDYEALLTQHGPLKAGQSHTLVRKLIDGNWVVQRDESGKAKSA